MAFKTYLNGKFFEYVGKYKKIKSIELPEKLKGTIIDRWVTYWRDVFRDYGDVAKDAVKEIGTKPWKGAVLISTLMSGTYFVKTNPDEYSFRNTLISYSNDLIFVGSSIRNPEGVKHLNYLEQCYNESIIKRFSFGLFSIMWIDNYNREVGVYKAVCPYLKPEYLKFHERIIDIGFCNKWWLIDKKMIDIDINPVEWPKESTN